MAPSPDVSRSDTIDAASSEATPLLGNPESSRLLTNYAATASITTNGDTSTNSSSKSPPQLLSQSSKQKSDSAQPMPYKQVLVLCYASLAEPVAYFAIFPFINEMLSRNGNLPEEDVGFWSGTIESLFSLVQMVLMIFYGRMADRVGRKPILVFSLTGVSIATALFGLSKTLWQMIFFRCLAGVFAGSVVTVRTMLSEITTKETQGRAFSWYMFTRNMGILVGPLIGGALANPATQYPGAFGKVQFLVDYPYALATFVAGVICLSGTLCSLFFLKETLNRKPSASTSTTQPPEPPMSTLQVLRSPGVGLVLYILAHTMTLALGYTAVMPVVMYEPVEKSGFGFSPAYISYSLATVGAAQALWILLVFPPLQKRVGSRRVLLWCAILWPFFMAAYPILNEFLRAGWHTAFWIVTPIMLVLGSGVSMAFAAVQLLINDISPRPEVLGTVNALSLTVNSGVRAVAPALFTSIYAIGIKLGWADGHLVWFVIVPIAALLYVAASFLPLEEMRDDDAPVKGDGRAGDEDEGRE
ncbi:Efflux pump [Sphaerulina musiva]